MQFGPYVRRLRVAQGMTLRELARQLDVSPTYISQIEQGNFAPPAEERVVRMAQILGQHPDELLARAGRVATSAVTEIQAGLATTADQSTLLTYVDELESRLTATRAANLDRLDATVSSRSTLTATDVWSQPARTITGMSAGTITATSFSAGAIDATAMAPSAVTEIQTDLATAANQTTILGYVDELESRLTTTRAANLDNLDAAISSRSTLTAANVWTNATRTITGVGSGGWPLSLPT